MLLRRLQHDSESVRLKVSIQDVDVKLLLLLVMAAVLFTVFVALWELLVESQLLRMTLMVRVLLSFLLLGILLVAFVKGEVELSPYVKFL